ncbi:hypothetical protein GQ457_10G018500 [Hibiscus cannabinus]
MNDVFRPFLRKFVLIFLDDILVYSTSWQEHLEHVRQVLTRLQEHGFVAKRSKCSFGQTTVEYLGHIVSEHGLAVDPAKIEAIKTWPVPKSMKDVWSFLGMAGYYRRFIRGFASIAAPISDLLRKGQPFEWNPTTQVAMEHLQDCLCSAPVLALPQFDKDFHFETDASGINIGAILTQEGKSLAYFSQKLCPRMQNSSTYSQEMYAIMQAVDKWRQYLVGRKFNIITDQRSLRELNQQTIQTPEQQRWLSKLVGYDFDIKYRPGKHNTVADALSHEMEANLMALSRPVLGIIEAIRAATKTDVEIQQLRASIQEGSTPYEVKDELVLFKGRVLVHRETTLRTLLLRHFHASVMGGHAGITRTFHRLAAGFYWVGMRSDVRQFVASCQVCQRMKSESLAPAGLLQPLLTPNQVFEDISMDFIVGLPKSNGKEAIFVVVDRLTKYGHFFALPRHFDAAYMARVFLQGVVKLHGIPCTIVSDRDRIFLSDLWTELAKLHDTELCFSSAYHPQSDGQTEALNRCLEMYLRCMKGDDPSKWEKFLAWAEYWYNTAFHTSAGMTPFQALYGRTPPTILSYLEGSSSNTQLAQELLDRDTMLQLLKTNLAQAQNRMKSQADQHRRELQLELKACKGQPLQQITPLPLLREEISIHTGHANLEDKVSLPGGGHVMEATGSADHESKQGQEEGMGIATPTVQVSKGPRRSMRERKGPKALVDFVLS